MKKKGEEVCARENITRESTDDSEQESDREMAVEEKKTEKCGSSNCDRPTFRQLKNAKNDEKRGYRRNL